MRYKENLKVAGKPDEQAARFRAADLLIERAKDDERVIKGLMPQFINFRGRDGCLCRQFPDGVTSSDKARNAVMQVSLLLYSTWAVRMDALMAIDDMLGTEFDSNAVYTDSIPEDEFKDVYDAVERALLQQIFLGRA